MPTEMVVCTVCEVHAEAVFRVEGMDCNEEVVILERRLKPLVGMESLSADLIGQRLHVKYDAAKLTTSAMVDAVGETGMRMWLEHEAPMLGGSALEWRWKLMLACGGFLIAAGILSLAGLPRVALPCYLAGTAAGIIYPIRRALTAARSHTLDINVLMVIAVAGALALGDWAEARRAWAKYDIECPPGDGAPEFDWGSTPVRLEPDGQGEVVWARRLDPARARIENVPLPTSPFRWGDVVLTDGAEEGQRIVDGRVYSVFNVLQRLAPSGFRTFVIEIATSQQEALDALEACATRLGGTAEGWGTSTRILCAACSRGLPHEHDDDGAPAHPHWGLAARDHDHAEMIVNQWLADTPSADLTAWYEAPGNGCG